ncbi:hypothetical protein [Lachnoclostridium sp.]|nr:hypothetical protein [Lachnoclostridium sp.]
MKDGNFITEGSFDELLNDCDYMKELYQKEEQELEGREQEPEGREQESD